MKRYSPTGGFALAALSFLFLSFGTPGSAFATCADLGGTVVFPECRIDSPQTKSGSFSVESGLTLHFVDTGGSQGGIRTGGAAITIAVHGDLIMDGNTFINANGGGCPGPFAGTITLNVDGNVTLNPTSRITSDGCKGGEIHITSGGNVDANGLIESVGTIGGVGNNQPPGGGPIRIDATCNLTVTNEGVVSSRGGDSGADLVSLFGGCFAQIFGLVESTGGGHSVPNNPPNHCATGVLSGKPANSTACVLIVGGDQGVTVDAKAHNGQVNADLRGAGKTSWVDIFASGPIKILGAPTEPFAVHANNGGNLNTGGTITAKSQASFLTASGLAFQADGGGSGSGGGTIVAEAALAVTLDESQNFARGDFAQSGGFGFGGHISARSFTDALNWRNFAGGVAAIGDVRPVGTGVTAAKQGSINLTACGGVNTSGTLFPVIGSAIPPFPVVNGSNCSASAPDIPSFITFQSCSCLLACP
jgi:hypothetical protein